MAGVPDRWFEKSWDAAGKAEIVLITTPDGAISETCREIVEHGGVSEKSTVLHCSGALSSEELSAARLSGAGIGSLHPLQSFAMEKSGNPFAAIMMAVEGDTVAVQTAGQMARDLGARPFAITTAGKIFYHGAAVAASNYLVTLMRLAVDLMAAAGVAEDQAFSVLKPLIHGTLKNIEDVGVFHALTGPIARGDAAIVEKHLAAIQEISPDMVRLYCALGRETINIARATGALSESATLKFSKLFDGFAA